MGNMKAFGKDIKAFYKTIPQGYYHEGEEFDEEEGEELNSNYDIDNLIDEKKYDLNKWGYIIKEGDDDNLVKFETSFKKWKAKQTSTTLVLEIKNERLTEVLAVIKKLTGVKVIK